jgi:hypothetical protein
MVDVALFIKRGESLFREKSNANLKMHKGRSARHMMLDTFASNKLSADDPIGE